MLYGQKVPKTHTVHISHIYSFMDRSCLWVDIQEVNYQKTCKDKNTTSEQWQG